MILDQKLPITTSLCSEELLKSLKENLDNKDLVDLEKLLNIDDTNLYNFYTGAETDFEIENNKVNLLFKNFKY